MKDRGRYGAGRQLLKKRRLKMTKLEKILDAAKAHTVGGREDGSSRTEIEFLDPGSEAFSFTFGEMP